MEQISFYNSFRFNVHHRSCASRTDNSCGIPYHYIARMISGSAKIVSLSGETIEVGEGEIFYLPKGLKYHSYWSCGEASEVAWESYGFKMMPVSSEIHYAMQKIEASEAEREMLDTLSRDIKVSPTSVGLLYLFVGLSLENMRRDTADSRAAAWERAVKYVSEHPNFRVCELAAHCHMSESGLFAFFKQYGGLTPVELKNQILVKRAVELLLTTDLSVEEICSRTGFCNAAYFRKQLRKVTGKTSLEIRREGTRI
ncbi:MAG: helix-turn-helix transcriptional regulator [Clostridia bacterium]|nr:helix-turn-helix transcriptional regulator [Clostridia bacterium]MBQ7348280.1 helix-turn-helix transcriptional regulator [Clostridia bacterium]